MAGTINLAFSQQFDMDGEPLSGGLLYFFTAGTTTPQSAFQDTGLTIVHPNPIILDASGRVPMFYLADGFIKIRLTDKNGVTIIAADQLMVIGPSSGTTGSSGTPGDVTATLATGDIKARYDTAVKDGFVRLNGNTIGNVGSSATERAEAVCQPLFEFLWAFPSITLEGFAKGANALADWGAGRRMILPDLRGRTIAGLDTMGAAAANRLTAAGLGVSGTVLGNAGGAETIALAIANLAAHTHTQQGAFTSGIDSVNHTHTQQGSFTTSGVSVDHTHAYTAPVAGSGASGGGLVSGTTGASTGGQSNDHTHGVTISGETGSVSAFHTHNTTISGSTSSIGSGTAFSKVLPTMVMTFYMKL